MADFNPVGIDLVTGQLRPITRNDIPTDSGGTLLVGYTGLRGVTGLMGETGILGPQGYTGLFGQTGALVSGIRGLTGPQGATGRQGGTGTLGRTGLTGRTGITGTTGVQGVTGAQGRGNYAILFEATTINASTPAGGPYILGVTGGGFTITLPLASSLGTREIIVQDEVGFAGTSPTTIATSGADTINGAANISLSVNYEAIKLLCDGSNLFLARRILQGPTGVVGATGAQGATGV